MKSSLGIRRICILAVTLVGLLIAYVFTRISANELFITAPVERGTFDVQLRASDPAWGLRDLKSVVELAGTTGFELAEVVDMPANNFSIVLLSEADRPS